MVTVRVYGVTFHQFQLDTRDGLFIRGKDSSHAAEGGSPPGYVGSGVLERDVSGRLRTAALSRGILVRRYTTVSAATPDHVWLHPAAAVFDGAALASAWELKSVATQATKAKFRPGQLPELCELVSAGLVAGAVVYVTSEAQWGVWRAPRRGQAAWCALMTASCWSVCTDGWLASPEAVVQLITGWVLSPRPPRP